MLGVEVAVEVQVEEGEKEKDLYERGPESRTPGLHQRQQGVGPSAAYSSPSPQPPP